MAKRGKPSRNEERGLSREVVLQAAIALIDEIGLERFSVRTLAQRMGVFPSAIYWWLPNRNTLLAAVVGAVLADIEPDVPRSDWKRWLRALLTRYRERLRQHPHVAPLVGSQLLSNAGGDLSLAEAILEVLSLAGFADDPLLEAFDVVMAAMVGFVTLELAAMPSEDSEDFAGSIRDALAGFDPASHPHLHRYRARMMNRHFLTRWENGITAPLDASFEAHLYTTVEGLRQLLTR